MPPNSNFSSIEEYESYLDSLSFEELILEAKKRGVL